MATGAVLSPLLDAKETPSVDELTLEDKKTIFTRLEAEVKRDYHVDSKISDPQPMDGVEYAYILNVGRCIGCRASRIWIF